MNTKRKRFLAPMVPEMNRGLLYNLYYFAHEWIGLKWDRLRLRLKIKLD